MTHWKRNPMPGKIESKRVAEDELVGCITDSVDMNLSKLLEIVKGRKAWHAAVHGIAKGRT